METPSLYEKMLLKSSEEKKSEDVQYAVESAKLQLEADILETSRILSEKKRTREAEIIRMPFSPGIIIGISDEIESYENGLKSLNKLKKELFG